MVTPIRASGRGAQEGESGFTLIELLVVIVIIGILAAIAIPIFLNQRAAASDASAKSDLRDLAQFQEAYFVEANTYGTIASLVAAGNEVRVSPGVTVSVIRYDGNTGYCLSAHHAGSGVTWYYDSGAGGLQPRTAAGCPVTVAGAPGDSVSG